MRKRISTLRIFLLVLIGFILIPSLLQAQQAQQAPQNELKVLFVGNSYTYGYNLAHIVSIISEETSVKLLTRKSTIGGAHLWEHWKGQRGLQTKKMIAEGDFDIVVLQDYSTSAIDTPDSTLKYVRLFAEYNSRFGTKTFLFNTWAREKVPQYQEEIDAMYEQAANENGATRVPVGAAWRLALDLRPSVDLYTSDGSHPNELGTMLTASVFVRTICGELPEKVPTLYRIEDARGETARLMNHNQEDAEFCKRIAEQIVSEYSN